MSEEKQIKDDSGVWTELMDFLSVNDGCHLIPRVGDEVVRLQAEVERITKDNSYLKRQWEIGVRGDVRALQSEVDFLQRREEELIKEVHRWQNECVRLTIESAGEAIGDD